MIMDWEYTTEAIFIKSCMVNDFLLLAYNEIYSETNDHTNFELIWTETGARRPFTMNVRAEPIDELIDMEAGELGIYALGKFGTQREYRVRLFNVEVDDADDKLVVVAERKVLAMKGDKAKRIFSQYTPNKIYLYYPDSTKQVPGVLLMAHRLVEEKVVGLVIYGFGDGDDEVDENTDELNKYSYNPFACEGTTTDHSECAGELLKNPEITNGNECEEYYYKTDFNTCAPCHYTCSSCTGPLSSQCINCRENKRFSAQLGQCFPGFEYSDGNWVPSTRRDQLVYRFGSQRDSCPSYTFDLIEDLGEVFNEPTVQNLYDFSEVCTKLSGPTNVVSMPNVFTISFWARITVIEGEIFMSVFGNLKLVAAGSYIDIRLPNLPQRTYTIEHNWDSPNWAFISVSLRNSALGYVITPFVLRQNTGTNPRKPLITTYTKRSGIPLSFGTYENFISIGCQEGTSSPSPSIIGGNILNLFFFPTYLNHEEINALKSVSYTSNLQISKLIYFWPLHPNPDNKLTDVSERLVGYFTSTVSFIQQDTTSPQDRLSELLELRKIESKFGVLGRCFDLFAHSKFPAFSFDTLNFAGNELQPKINFNSYVYLGAVIRENDLLLFTYGGCNNALPGYKLISSARVTLEVTGNVKLTQTQRLSESVRGTYIDSCYCFSSPPRCHWLGKTYFPLLPIQIHPAHGMSDRASSRPLQFELKGGDQSYGDKLTLVNMEKDVLTAIDETIVVDEKDIGYSSYSTIKRTTGQYDNLVTNGLDSGVYTIAWRPSYMSYLVNERNVIYKNLYTTWTLQAPPKVKFPEISGVIGMPRNTVVFKSEFFYIELVGDGQADGDQIIFCEIGCNYFNRQGDNVFQRENGRYPPILFGDNVKDGVGGIKGGSPTNRLQICWRPAARAVNIQPKDDQWLPLESLHDPKAFAFVILNAVQTNLNKVDIKELSLSIRKPSANNIIPAPVLFHGNPIWFELSCVEEETQRLVRIANEGLIKISHVVYNTYDRSSYTPVPIWQDQAENGELKKLRRSFNKFMLQEIPYSLMKPGNDYMLVIYSDTFLCLEDTANAHMQLQFNYLFRYQEAAFETPKNRKLAPIVNDLSIGGSNIGTLNMQGNGFVETRKLFGVVVDIKATPPCSSPIRASYIPGTLEDNPKTIELKEIDLTHCTSVDTLTVDLKLLKIADGFGDWPLWSVTNTSKQLILGSVGCDPSCATCSGPSSYECLTCHSLDYLYKNRCLSKCENDLPIANIIFKETSNTIDYYECTKECKPGFYKDSALRLCIECNYQCATCSSGRPMSCTGCKGMVISDTESAYDYMNFYIETYSFKGMCLLECPSITNALSGVEADGDEVIITDEINRVCNINHPLVRTNEMEVHIQAPIYNERVDIRRQIQLRAILTDKRDCTDCTIVAKYSWSSYLPEVLTNELYSSDRRIFQNYSDENLKQAITVLNMNAFNFKSGNDQMRIIVKAWDSELKLFDFDMIELFSNRPPEIDAANIMITIAEGEKEGEVVTQNTKLETMNTINIDISDVQDYDDYYLIIKFKVLLVPRSLVLPNPIPDTAITPESALVLLAQLPGNFLTLYSSKEILLTGNNNVRLENIYIPPLINGLQVISRNDGITSNEVTADLYIYAEDRHLGLTKIKSITTIKEKYELNMGDTICTLLKAMNKKVKDKVFDWDDALRIAHTFRAINPEHKLYYMSFTKCSRDDHCGAYGKCSTSGGWSKCRCDSKYTGEACNWELEDLMNEKKLVDIVMNFLDTTFLSPSSADSAFEMTDINLIDQVANLLIGLLKNPEAVDSKYLDDIVNLAWYMTYIDKYVGGRMEEFERSNIFSAIDTVIKYVYYRLKEDIYKYYTLREEAEQFTISQKAEYTEMRERLVKIITKVRDLLYRFVDAGSLVQYPTSAPYAIEYDTFEVLIASQFEDKLFQTLEDSVGLQMASGKEFIRIPPTLLTTLRAEVSQNEEFKFRIIKWKENPYVFSDYNTGICSPVYNFAILNSNGEVITKHLNEPLVFFMPISASTKNLPTDAIRCKQYNPNNEAYGVVKTKEKINVNELDLTDQEKMALYPEWKPEFYHSKNLIVEKISYTSKLINYPEFQDISGTSSYGNILKTTEYKDMIKCAVYSSAEITAIAERKKSFRRDFNTQDFIYDFDPLTTIYMNVGTYVCVIIGSLFIASMFLAYVVDGMLMPAHINKLILYRKIYNEMETSNASGQLYSVPSTSGDMGEGQDRETKEGENNASKHRAKKAHGKARLSRKRNRKSRGEGTGDNVSTMLVLKSKDVSTDDKLVTNTSEVNRSRNIKEGDVTTQMNIQMSTYEVSDENSVWSTSDPQKMSVDDKSFKNLFSGTKPDAMSLRGNKDGYKFKDIFSKEYKDYSEVQEYRFCNIYKAANLLLNIIRETSTSFSRIARTFVLYSYIYFLMFWSASLIASCSMRLTHPEDEKDVIFLVSSNVWIMFVSPILSSIMVYLVAGMFKVNEKRIRDAITVAKYQQVM